MNIVVIGAGASGIIAALVASKNNKVILVDSCDKIGKKILLTGSGKCNYWNSNINIEQYNTDCIDNLNEILNQENIKSAYNLLEKMGIYPKIKNGYYYPYSNQATSVREIFEREIKKSNIILKTNFKVEQIIKENNIFKIISNNEILECDKVILTTGSKAYSKTGSDGSGYMLASNLGHTINEVFPALTPLITNDSCTKDWENIRCDAKVSLYINKQKIKEEIGEIQLTKNGISGICTFNISALASKNLTNNVEISISFLPYIDSVFEFLQTRNELLKNKNIEELLESIFHYKLMFTILKRANINKNSKWEELTEREKIELCNQIENFKIKIIGTEDFEKSQVCTGGVSLKEINPITMESIIIPNLFLAGEILDVDGKCGGFNLAFAFITGYLAGGNISC